MPDLAGLLRSIRHEPVQLGILPMLWTLKGGGSYYDDRARHGVLRVPDVIGEVVAWGRLEDAWPLADPAGTIRAEHARVGRALHLSSHVDYMAPAIQARYPDSVIRVGEARGLAWLDEIAATIPSRPAAA